MISRPLPWAGTMAGDNESLFEDLFRRYYKRVVAFLMYLGFPADDARDLAQDTFIRVYRTMDAYRREAEWAFLRTTAHNVAKNRIRDDSTLKRKVMKVAIEDVVDPGDPAPGADDVLITTEETARFRKRYNDAVARLPERSRDAFLLRAQGHSYEEMAAILRVPLNTVKSRLHDAKQRLRNELGKEPQGIDWPEAAGDGDERPE
jgi:RNA polymerase sigma-70 factor (ECF subfamily)